ncbi:hypothetical protein [Chitinolyticbacter albus]|uniref:hypothetical protein n=1 Tax=Chitinolyticbacter albus TaxID=2961951 RepID=UPI00210DC00E|nr:hypothetical protein [Chitinolyticbacter albus]
MQHLQKTVLVAMTLLASASLLAQKQDEAEQKRIEAEMCAQTKCQRNLRVTLKDKDGATFDRTFKVFPAVVQPFGFVVVAGQTVYVEATVVDGQLTNLVAVEAASDPGKTITAKFEQFDGKRMMLTVSNPFPKLLKFNMGIMPLDKEELYKTSSCPVIPGGQAVEMWPYPIFQVVLSNGRLLQESDTVACVE